MASNIIKQTCIKCSKGGGIALCHGCQQTFCAKHFLEHREELSQSIDIIGQEHDLLRRDMSTKSNTSLLLVERINQWEKETIEHIHRYTNQIRSDLQQTIKRMQSQNEISVNELADELRACRVSDDYTELNIQRWNERLKQLREIIDNLANVNIQYETIPTTDIPWIRLNNNLAGSNSTISSSNERFSEYYGLVNISTDRLVASSHGTRWDGSCASGIGRYSSATHSIRFRIENKQSSFIFFGILTSSQKLSAGVSNAESLNGWWDLGYNVISGKARDTDETKTLFTGDEITLLLNCEQKFIRLEHHRMNMCVELSIDLNCCPFPWKILVRLCSEKDSVRIL